MGQMPPWLAGLGMAASSLFVVANAARLARLDDESPGAPPARA
jgi:Cu2+-exporting ATPase